MREVKTYVIRKSRMTSAQKKNIDELSDSFCIPYRDSLCHFENYFLKVQPLTIEIGFGMGDATASIAEENPDKNYLGIEVHAPGVGKLLGEIKARNLKNLLIVQYDAVSVLQNMVEDESTDAVHIFFPDPWPKKRHHKRRLVQKDFLALCARKLKRGGYFYFVSDWEEYADEVLAFVHESGELQNRFPDFATHREWRKKTKFEMRAEKEGRAVREIFCSKK